MYVLLHIKPTDLPILKLFHERALFRKYEIQAKKVSKSERNRKNLMRTDTMFCKTLWSGLPFRVLLNVGIYATFNKKFIFLLYSERNFAFLAKKL